MTIWTSIQQLSALALTLRGLGSSQEFATRNVTADQAIIAESVTTGAGRNVASPALLAASPEMPIPNVDQITQPDPAGMGGGIKSI